MTSEAKMAELLAQVVKERDELKDQVKYWSDKYFDERSKNESVSNK